MCRIVLSLAVLAGVGLAGGALTGCTSGGASPSPSPTTGTASPAATTSAPPTTAAPSVSPSVNYAQQYLADQAGWAAAAKRAAGSGSLTAPKAIAAGRAAVATARKLLSQTWPASIQSDMHALAVAFDTINEDIASDNRSKYLSDGTTVPLLQLVRSGKIAAEMFGTHEFGLHDMLAAYDTFAEAGKHNALKVVIRR
ncbi:MAG: hypothetical protein ACRDNF_11840 [Streptosporangiaceae bacterium]